MPALSLMCLARLLIFCFQATAHSFLKKHIISKIYNLLSTEREIDPIQNLVHFSVLPPELSGDEIISMRGWGVKLIARKVQRLRGKWRYVEKQKGSIHKWSLFNAIYNIYVGIYSKFM